MNTTIVIAPAPKAILPFLLDTTVTNKHLWTVGKRLFEVKILREELGYSIFVQHPSEKSWTTVCSLLPLEGACAAWEEFLKCTM